MNKPKMMMMHPNCKGTGCSFGFELHPARVVDGQNVEGSIVLEVAHQMTVGDRTRGVAPSFDFERTVCVRLFIGDVARMLQVFRGECEAIENGIRKVYEDHLAVIELRHVIEPVQGYQMVVTSQPRGAEGADDRFVILFSSAEALAVCEAMTGALVWMAFGDPRVCHCAEGRAE